MMLALASVNCTAAGTKGRTKAEAWATKAAATFGGSGSPKLEAAALNCLASIHIKEQEPEEALRVATEAVAVAKDIGDKKEEAMALHSMGWAHMLLKASDAALEKAEEALALWKELGLKNKQAMESCAIAKVFMQQGNSFIQGVATHWRAQYLMWSAKPPPVEEALELATKAQNLFQRTKDSDWEANSLVLMGYLNLAAGKRQMAAQNVQQAVTLAADDAATVKICSDALEFIENYVDVSAGAPMPGGGRGGRPGVAAPAASVAVAGSKPGLDPAMVKTKITQLVNDTIATGEDVAMDVALMDAGLDSLAATDLTSQVAREFQIGITPSLVFDFPTVREMVAHLVEESQS